MTSCALEITGLRKSYGPIVALAGVDLDVQAGQVLALLGVNGAGKTTLTSIVMGLVRADSGTIRVFGRDAFEEPRFVHEVTGFVPQETGIYPTLTVRENLEFFGRIIGISRRQLRSETDELLAALDLMPLAGRPARRLSTGEKRRVHTAVALLGRPRVLFLDEPTVGADIQTRQRLIEIVRSRAADGAAIVYTTHYLPEVEHLDATVAVLHRGRIITQGTCADLVRDHGRTELRFTFDGDAPAAEKLHGVPAVADGSTLSIVSDTPWTTLGAALTALGTAVDRIRSLEVVRAELESVFLDLTADTAHDVAAS